jgi:hypothetical protein
LNVESRLAPRYGSSKPLSQSSGARRERITREEVQDESREADERIAQEDDDRIARETDVHAQVEVKKEHRDEQHQRQGQEEGPHERIANPSRVPEALGDALIGRVLMDFDRDSENGLRQHVTQAGAEEPDSDPKRHVGAPERHTRPDEIDDDAEVRELGGQPHVRPAGQPLKPVAAPFEAVQDGRIQVRHRSRGPVSRRVY